jgi:hypothetical protein
MLSKLVALPGRFTISRGVPSLRPDTGANGSQEWVR